MRTPHVQVDQRRGKALVAQQAADRQQIDARFQQCRGETVSHRVWRDGLADPRVGRRPLAGLLDGGSRKRDIRRLAREKIVGRTGGSPIPAKFAEQAGRERHQPLFVPLAVADEDLHPLAVDVCGLQVRGFAQPQAGGVTRCQHCPALCDCDKESCWCLSKMRREAERPSFVLPACLRAEKAQVLFIETTGTTGRDQRS